MKTIELRKILYQYLVDNNILDLNTRISFLIPQKDKGFYKSFIFYEIRKNEIFIASEPIAIVDINFASGEIEKFENVCTIEKKPNWISYSPLPIEDIKKNISRIIEIFDELQTCFFKEKINEDLKVKKNNLFVLFTSVIPLEMMKYYEKWGKDFFLWLNQ